MSKYMIATHDDIIPALYASVPSRSKLANEPYQYNSIEELLMDNPKLVFHIRTVYEEGFSKDGLSDVQCHAYSLYVPKIMDMRYGFYLVTTSDNHDGMKCFLSYINKALREQPYGKIEAGLQQHLYAVAYTGNDGTKSGVIEVFPI